MNAVITHVMASAMQVGPVVLGLGILGLMLTMALGETGPRSATVASVFAGAAGAAGGEPDKN